MNVLIATPCYGGQMSSRYFLSALETADWLTEGKIGYEFCILDNESLITRARNKLAYYAMERDFDKLFFIDSDISWGVSDFARILQSSEFIIGGLYPLKQYPLKLNFNPSREHVEIYGKDVSLKAFRELAKLGNEKGELAVRHVPTGFMMIDCAVLRAMTTKRPKYLGEHPLTGEKVEMHDLFPAEVRDGIYESEDWAFCSKAREMGFKTCINTNVVVTHIGSNHFKVDLNEEEADNLPKPQGEIK